MPFVCDCVLVPLSQCARRPACIDPCHLYMCWHFGSGYFPVSELHVLSISNLSFWMPTKTVLPVSRPLCQYIKVSSAVSSRKWLDIIYVKSRVQIGCNPPGFMERLQEHLQTDFVNFDSGQLETCGQEMTEMYVAMLHVKMWCISIGEFVLIMYYSKDNLLGLWWLFCDWVSPDPR